MRLGTARPALTLRRPGLRALAGGARTTSAFVRGRRLAIVVGLGCVLVVPAISGARDSYPPTCRSGKTLFHRGKVRAFHVRFYDREVRGDHEQILACRGSRRPLKLFDPGPFNSVRAERFALTGARLGFVVHAQGMGNGSQTDVGWADLRTRTVRRGTINAGENAGTGDPLLPEDHLRYAIAADGAMALIAGSRCQVVAVLPLRSARRLGPPVVMYTARDGGLDASSIALSDSAVSWRTTSGAPSTVDRAPAGRTSDGDPTGGC